jgi:hypothetical protein
VQGHLLPGLSVGCPLAVCTQSGRSESKRPAIPPAEVHGRGPRVRCTGDVLSAPGTASSGPSLAVFSRRREVAAGPLSGQVEPGCPRSPSRRNEGLEDVRCTENPKSYP